MTLPGGRGLELLEAFGIFLQAQDGAVLDANLAWMVRQSHQDTVLRGARYLAETLLECGVVLPPVTATAPPPRPRLEMLH